MANDWVLGRLGDHVDACLGKMLDQKKNKGELHPYIGNKNVRWGSFELDDLLEMRFEDHEHERYGLQYGDLVVCEGGVPGRCAIWKNEIPNMKIQKALHRIRTHKSLNNYYLHYWFTWSGNNGLLDAYFTGTTIKHLSGKALSNIEIPIPPIEIQERIARILVSLDDKIELNRQMNETLEMMGQALFKSWFVDFDPVIDNALAAGNAIPDELLERAEQRKNIEKKDNLDINNVFPDEFEFTEEMGWIPKGWGFSEVRNFGHVVCGKTPSKKKAEYYGNDISFIKIPDMHNVAWATTTTDNLSFEGSNSQKNKIIPKGSICVSCIATVGKVLITSREAHTNQQINSLIPAKKNTLYYLYSSFLGMEKRLQDLASGGAVTLNLNTSNFSKIKLILPPTSVLDAYDSSVNFLYEKNLNLLIQNETLAKLRDTLLPKLMSGELHIPDDML